jgi:hypothetical protein
MIHSILGADDIFNNEIVLESAAYEDRELDRKQFIELFPLNTKSWSSQCFFQFLNLLGEDYKLQYSPRLDSSMLQFTITQNSNKVFHVSVDMKTELHTIVKFNHQFTDSISGVWANHECIPQETRNGSPVKRKLRRTMHTVRIALHTHPSSQNMPINHFSPLTFRDSISDIFSTVFKRIIDFYSTPQNTPPLIQFLGKRFHRIQTMPCASSEEITDTFNGNWYLEYSSLKEGGTGNFIYKGRTGMVELLLYIAPESHTILKL